jgi:apolipoprotein N-acyltransferase
MKAWKFLFNYFAILILAVSAAFAAMLAFPPEKWRGALAVFVGVLMVYVAGYVHGLANAKSHPPNG